MKKTIATIALLGASVLGSQANAWWDMPFFGNGLGNGIGDGNFSMNMNARTNVATRGYGYGNPYNGYGYAPYGYGYAPYGYGPQAYAPVAPVAPQAEAK